MQINFNRNSEDDIRRAKQQWEDAKTHFKQMKPRDIIMMILVFGICLIFLGLAVYGGSIDNLAFILTGVIGFVGFLLSLALVQFIIKSTSINAIKKNPMAIEDEGIVLNLSMYSSANVNGRMTRLTLKVVIDINSTESTGYYKLNKEEIQTLRGVNAGVVLSEAAKTELPIKAGDKLLVKYVPAKPKTCIILEKLAGIESSNYYGNIG